MPLKRWRLKQVWNKFQDVGRGRTRRRALQRRKRTAPAPGGTGVVSRARGGQGSPGGMDGWEVSGRQVVESPGGQSHRAALPPPGEGPGQDSVDWGTLCSNLHSSGTCPHASKTEGLRHHPRLALQPPTCFLGPGHSSHHITHQRVHCLPQPCPR